MTTVEPMGQDELSIRTEDLSIFRETDPASKRPVFCIATGKKGEGGKVLCFGPHRLRALIELLRAYGNMPNVPNTGAVNCGPFSIARIDNETAILEVRYQGEAETLKAQHSAFGYLHGLLESFQKLHASTM